MKNILYTMEEKNRRKICFVLPFLVTFILCVTLTAAYVSNRMLLEQSQMEQIAMSRANKVNAVLTKLLYKTQVLSALVVRNEGEVKDFEQMAATILDDAAIKNLILAPDGIVEYVYPMKGNEAVMGLDYFSQGEGNKEAIQARDTQQLVLGGPFKLVQGGQALVGRQPIYLSDGMFWGIASVTLDYPQALAGADLEQLRQQGFAYEIWRVSPDTEEKQVIARSDYNYNTKALYVEYPMDILNASWYFKLSPIRAWYEFPETWVFVVFGVLISTLIGMLMLHNYDLNKMKKSVEEISMHDPLTKALNRRGLFQALENIENKPPFLLCYLDLDGFKNINDLYGHHRGDIFLQKFSYKFLEKIDEKKHIFARIGGDEFVLVFKDENSTEQVDTWLEETKANLKVCFGELDYQCDITFSAGYAIYPMDGKSVDELLAAADKKMYQAKKDVKIE